jgi:chloride channel protein, CIC family
VEPPVGDTADDSPETGAPVAASPPRRNPYLQWPGRIWNALRNTSHEGLATASRDLAHWAVIAVPIGVVAGLGASLFFFLWSESTRFFLTYVVGIGYPYPGATGSQVVVWSSSFPRILLLPVVMGLGGLGAGLIIQLLAPEVAGHGTDDTIDSFHNRQGVVRARVPYLKMIASALTLGSGGSGGREGPTSQIGAGFGSWWADRLQLSDRDRRIALATGLGAGVGAIFRAPLGGAIFSAEIMYTGDLEPAVLVPSIIASVVSYSIYGSIYGFGTLFGTPSNLGWQPLQLPLYVLLALVCAGVGVAFVRLFWGTHGWFQRLPWPVAARVSLGAVMAGLVVLAAYFALPWQGHFAALSALNVGYGFVQSAMLGQVGLTTLVPLALLAFGVAIVLRMVTTSFTVGSGGAAGLFGTSVVIGALIGASIGGLFHALLPTLVGVGAISAFSIVGMMSFFGGISKAPLAVLVMAVEMTGSYEILAPAMVAIFVAYVATGKNHIYRTQVPTRLDSPAHRDEYIDYLHGRGADV